MRTMGSVWMAISRWGIESKLRSYKVKIIKQNKMHSIALQAFHALNLFAKRARRLSKAHDLVR